MVEISPHGQSSNKGQNLASSSKLAEVCHMLCKSSLNLCMSHLGHPVICWYPCGVCISTTYSQMSYVLKVPLDESSTQKQGTFLQKPEHVVSLLGFSSLLLWGKRLFAGEGLGHSSFRRTPKLSTTICVITKHSFTQLVASNIFTSSGSPWILPSQTISEWQTAIALNTGPQGRLWSAGKLWMSWKLTQKGT